MQDQQNIDLTYAVIFNLAHQYHQNNQGQEALQTYQTIVKNKSFAQSGRLRVNMGNIYFEQGKLPNAIKMYRMVGCGCCNLNPGCNRLVSALETKM